VEELTAVQSNASGCARLGCICALSGIAAIAAA
jgi:hypothetical protein